MSSNYLNKSYFGYFIYIYFIHSLANPESYIIIFIILFSFYYIFHNMICIVIDPIKYLMKYLIQYFFWINNDLFTFNACNFNQRNIFLNCFI